MRIATWNVNSIRTRVGRVVDYMIREDIDVLAMQETKCTPEQFPLERFEEAGYEVSVHGLNQWNGVAIASRLPLFDIATEWPGMPGFKKGEEGPDLPLEARAIGATIGDVRVWSVYVPNGRSLDDPHYAYKLDWLRSLADYVRTETRAHPETPFAIMGDFNIIPFAHDNGDPSIVEGRSTHVSPAEREAFHAFEAAGVTDVVRPLIPESYTYWDYKALKFPRDEGVRIDFVLGSQAFADSVTDAAIHRDQRTGDSPSDHVPVLVEVEVGDEDADRPMIF